MLAFCEECGMKLVEGAAFCEQCGTPVSVSELEKKVTPVPQIDTEKEILPDLMPSDEEQKITDPVPSVEKIHLTGSSPIVKDQAREEATPTMEESKEVLAKEPEQTIIEEEIYEIPKKKGKKAFILMGVALLVVISGGMYWWMNQKEGKATSTPVITESSESSDTLVSTVTTQESSMESEQSAEESSDLVEDVMAFDTKKIEKIASNSVGSLSNLTGVYVAPVGKPELAYTQNGERPIKAASIVKLYIMMAVYNQVNEGYVNLADTHTLEDYQKVGGTGVLQNYSSGTKITYEELVRLMIVESDNTAGNILISMMGGTNVLTELIQNKGYRETRIERYFVDSEALNKGFDNYTSVDDVGNLLNKLYQQQLVTPNYDQQMLNLLKENKNQTKIPAQIGSEVTVYNKTGEYSDYGVQNDACILANGEIAYVVVVLSQDGTESTQLQAMSQFGSSLYKELLQENLSVKENN